MIKNKGQAMTKYLCKWKDHEGCYNEVVGSLDGIIQSIVYHYQDNDDDITKYELSLDGDTYTLFYEVRNHWTYKHSFGAKPDEVASFLLTTFEIEKI